MLRSSMRSEELACANIHWMKERIAKEAVEQFSASKRRILAVDGCMGSGKSLLSLMLEFELGLECLHVDDFLPPATPAHGERRFVDVLELPQLHEAINAHLAKGPLLIEGILIRDILARVLPEQPIFHVYVAATWRPSENEVRWNEGDRLSEGIAHGALDTQVVEYHRRVMPQGSYDFAALRGRDDFGRNGIFLAPDGQKFEIPKNVLRDSRFNQRKRRFSAIRCNSEEAVLAPLGLITPPVLTPTIGLSDEELRGTLTAVVSETNMPAALVTNERGKPWLALRDGVRQYVASVAAGFTQLPVIYARE